MPLQPLDIIGIIANLLLVSAYYPQLAKIIKTKSAGDISLKMWIMTAMGDILLLAYAIIKNEIIFIILFTVFCVENIALLLLTHKYKDNHPPISHLQKDHENLT